MVDIVYQETISIRANTIRPPGDHRLDGTTFGAGTFSVQDPVHSCKSGPGEVMTVENLFTLFTSRMATQMITQIIKC